jgi:hypothetical protein
MLNGRPEPNVDISRKQRRVQACRQRIAQMQRRPPRRAKTLQRIFRDKTHRAQGRAKRAPELTKMRNVEPVDHHAAEHSEFRQRRTQPPKVHSQAGAIEGDGLEHAATGRCSRLFRIIVRIRFHRLKPDLGIRFEILDRLRTTRQKCISQVSVFSFGNGTGEIVSGIGQSVINACVLHLGVDGNPDHPARPSRRPPDKFRLLDQEDAQSLRSSDRGSRHAAGARANDDDVIGVGNRRHAWNRAVTNAAKGKRFCRRR